MGGKKNFTSGINGLLNSSTDTKESTNSAKDEKKLVRANLVMESHYHKTLKIVAAREGVKLTEALCEALDDFFVKKGKLLEKE